MTVPAPVRSALDLLLAGVQNPPADLQALVIAPAAGTCGPAANGPVDAVRDHGVMHTTVGTTAVTLRILSAQHTRCWLLSCDLPGQTFSVGGPMSGVEVLPAAVTDTAQLSEFMLDRGLGDDWPHVVRFGSPDRLLVAFTEGIRPHAAVRARDASPESSQYGDIRVAVLGAGAIGKRVIHEVLSDNRFTLAGVVVRSANVFVHARPDMPYYAFGEDTARTLQTQGVGVRGRLEDLLAQADVIIDCGPSRSGATRAALYHEAGIRSVFCGGERDRTLGPVVHPALSSEELLSAQSVRLTSCNTTALARVVAALAPASINELNVTVVRCCTDTDKAGKGITNGAVLGPAPSHHAQDLVSVVPGLRATSLALTVPMDAGHVIHARIALSPQLSRKAALARLAEAPRLNVIHEGSTIDQAHRRATTKTPWHNRYDLDVQVVDTGTPDRLDLWLALDNEAITIPEALDVLATTTTGPARGETIGVGPAGKNAAT
ncbi:type II glyceraldehyde-3-phosphate dehydrogenase [Kitasatospora sp. NPDC058048]|uniref:type II glyceraldehyde-3-phosphate dehydrogenase n=1 Tax=Kitasatospora sp. NPDC058048 TaxID=3346313 RepID=UPI0036DD1A63